MLRMLSILWKSLIKMMLLERMLRLNSNLLLGNLILLVTIHLVTKEEPVEGAQKRRRRSESQNQRKDQINLHHPLVISSFLIKNLN